MITGDETKYEQLNSSVNNINVMRTIPFDRRVYGSNTGMLFYEMLKRCGVSLDV